ncbi:MAG: alpha-galactosidase, partial [Bacteroidales bacterium]|nr:alpha-galactosidase [Bacteroidales bacterium]
MRYLAFIFIVSLFMGCTRPGEEETISLHSGWKFKTGDNLAWSDPAFADSAWDTIAVDRIWEESGFDPYDGYAWYRLHFMLPESVRENASLKDSLLLFMGKINNWDQTFLNGKIIGINNVNVSAETNIDTSFLNAPINYWDLERWYTLAADDPRILWDQENVLAVRVYDQGGQGGMYTGNQTARMTALTDYLKIDVNREPFVFENGSLSKKIYLKNSSSNYTMQGILTIDAINKLTGKQILKEEKKIDLQPVEEIQFPISIPQLDQSVLFTCHFENTQGDVMEEQEESPYICTPAPPAEPRIHGARVVGCRPGRPFLYAIASTGNRPIHFTATGLPEGFVLEEETGIITSGQVDKRTSRQVYQVEIVASNTLGSDTTTLKIIIGDQIALTPPMGWNSWNCWGLSVTQEKVLSSAKAFRDKGLMDHGWCYVNIDDGWEIPADQEPKRDQQGTILCNEKFPDMKALGDSIHAMGLKLGIYSSPGPLTCGGYTASYQYELQDAGTFADWGIDYLKYDWCSYGNIAQDTSLAERKKPYFVMQDALKKVNRDIVYSLCQYGMSHVWTWGEEAGGNLWRTTGDITDTWESLKEIGFGQLENAPFAGPGHWNDPDMLIVGWVGWGPNLHPTRLTP